MLVEIRQFWPGGGVLPYIAYMGTCHCEGYGSQAVWSGIGYRSQGVLVSERVSDYQEKEKFSPKWV